MEYEPIAQAGLHAGHPEEVKRTAIDDMVGTVVLLKDRLRTCIGKAARLADAALSSSEGAPPMVGTARETERAGNLNDELSDLQDLIADLETTLARFES